MKYPYNELWVVVKCWAGAETLIQHTTGHGGFRFSAHTNEAEAKASADMWNRDSYGGNPICQARRAYWPGSGILPDAACFFKDGNAWCCVRGDFTNLQESPAGFGETMEAALNHLHAQCTKDNASVCRPRQSDGVAN